MEPNRSVDELQAAYAAMPAAPRDEGKVAWLVRRPVSLEREVMERAELCPERGLVGDCWPSKPSKRTADGSPHPEMQLTLMNTSVTEVIAGPKEAWTAAGDQVYVDFDLSEASLPAGTRLQLGSAVIEITAEEHLGCGKFHERFGSAALRWVNGKERRALRLRGVNAKVVQAGEVAVGDQLRRIEA
jgi:MOSC domain-containing protein